MISLIKLNCKSCFSFSIPLSTLLCLLSPLEILHFLVKIGLNFLLIVWCKFHLHFLVLRAYNSMQILMTLWCYKPSILCKFRWLFGVMSWQFSANFGDTSLFYKLTIQFKFRWRFDVLSWHDTNFADSLVFWTDNLVKVLVML